MADESRSLHAIAVGVLRTDLLMRVSDVQGWKLATDRWAAVRQAIHTAEEALESGDPTAIRAAVAELTAAGPDRVLPLGMETPVAIPADLRERIVHLTHVRQSGAAPPPADPPDARRPD